jgi:hypothetical protein
MELGRSYRSISVFSRRQLSHSPPPWPDEVIVWHRIFKVKLIEQLPLFALQPAIMA